MKASNSFFCSQFTFFQQWVLPLLHFDIIFFRCYRKKIMNQITIEPLLEVITSFKTQYSGYHLRENLYSPITIRLLSYDSVWNLRYVTRYLRKLRRNLQVKTICLICTRCLKERRRKVNLQNEDRLDWAQSFAFSFGYSNTQFHTIKPIQIWYEKGRFFVRYFTLKPFFICVMHVKRAFVYLKSLG